MRPLCPKCDEDKYTVEYQFASCPAISLTHMELFGSVDVKILSKIKAILLTYSLYTSRG